MTARLDHMTVSPNAVKAMYAFEAAVRHLGLEPSLLHLIKLRGSYANGCAYCIDMHSKDARIAGETEQRIYAIPVWHETPFFTPRERAALLWTEAVTNIQDGGVPDDIFAEVKAQFTDAEMVNLTLAVNAINSWNRIAISFRAVPGSYQPPETSA